MVGFGASEYGGAWPKGVPNPRGLLVAKVMRRKSLRLGPASHHFKLSGRNYPGRRKRRKSTKR